jgi:PAS domain S-box-containing protein
MDRPSNAATRFARLIGAIALLTSLLVLAGWVLGIVAITSIVPGWPRMVALTAAAFVFASVALCLALPLPTAENRVSVREAAASLRSQIFLACSGLVALIGLVRLAAYWFGWNVGRLESLLLSSPATHGRALNGGMSPATALGFALLGAALLLVRNPRLTRLYQLLATLVLLIGWIGIARYVFGGVPLLPFTGMAFHTAVLFLILSVGVLSLRRDAGLTALLVSEGAGGASARHLLPAAIVLPVCAGALALYSEHAGWLGPEAGVPLFALSSLIVFAGLVCASAAHLERTERERRRVREALRSSEERTRLIIDTALDAVITIDHSGMITGWSAQAESLFGWSRGEAIGRSLAQTIIPERDREAHQRGLQRYLQTGVTRVLNRRIELAAVDREQREFPVEIAITAMRSGEEISFSAFVRDITERARAEAALRESQQLLQAIIDNSQAVIYVKDLDGRYLLVNRRFEEIFHLRRDAILGRTDRHFFPQEAADAFRAMDVRVAGADHALTEEETVPQVDGPHIYLSVKAPLRNAEGQTYAIFGISTDITDRKRGEARLRSQLARLNLLDETTRAIGDRQDLRSIFQVVIHSLEEHLPIDFGAACLCDTTQQVLSITCAGVGIQALAEELMQPEHARIGIEENGLGRCARGELVYESEIAQSPFPFFARLAGVGLHSLVFAPLMVGSKIFGVMIAARRAVDGFTSGDCEFLRQLSGHVALAAHQSQLYAALQQAYEDLRHTQQTVMQQERLRALGQMASGIAHDINNALSPAALYVQSLLERDQSLRSEAREYLVITQRAIEDVANTVARMREFYRPSEPQVTPVPVDLNVVLQQVVDLTHARWSDMPQERGILVHVQSEFAADLPRILGAGNEIRDALTNLVLNAVDAMPDGGTLTLRSYSKNTPTALRTDELPATHVSVEVCDTGIGMSEAVRNRCLEPFYTTKGERGTGLGLAMVYGMIQRHGGELEIDSEPGVGTTLRLIFPVAAISAASVSARYNRPLERLRILVVDDDPLLLKSLQETLEQDGHLVAGADGGQAGIDAFCAALQRRTPFQVVVTDLGMPNIDGRTVAAAIKSRTPATPVILLTGWGYRLRAENEVPQHVDRVLSKPPKLHDLREALLELTSGGTGPRHRVAVINRDPTIPDASSRPR